MDDKDTFEIDFLGWVMLRHCPWTVTLMIFHIDQAGTPRPRGPLELVGIGRSPRGRRKLPCPRTGARGLMIFGYFQGPFEIDSIESLQLFILFMGDKARSWGPPVGTRFLYRNLGRSGLIPQKLRMSPMSQEEWTNQEKKCLLSMSGSLWRAPYGTWFC